MKTYKQMIKDQWGGFDLLQFSDDIWFVIWHQAVGIDIFTDAVEKGHLEPYPEEPGTLQIRGGACPVLVAFHGSLVDAVSYLQKNHDPEFGLNPRPRGIIEKTLRQAW